jgi:hypothetical protein
MRTTNKLPLVILVAVAFVVAAAFGVLALAEMIAERFGPTAGFVALLLPVAAATIAMVVYLVKDGRRKEFDYYCDYYITGDLLVGDGKMYADGTITWAAGDKILSEKMIERRKPTDIICHNCDLDGVEIRVHGNVYICGNILFKERATGIVSAGSIARNNKGEKQ